MVSVAEAGKTEIGHLRHPPRLHQDVPGLQIAMDDASMVGEVDRLAQGHHQTRRLTVRETPFRGQLLQVRAIHVFQGQIWLTLVFADFVDLDDVGMLQGGNGLGLAAKTSDSRCIGRTVGQDHLDGDGSLQSRVIGFVNNPHAAVAQHQFDDVRPDTTRSGNLHG